MFQRKVKSFKQLLHDHLEVFMFDELIIYWALEYMQDDHQADLIMIMSTQYPMWYVLPNQISFYRLPPFNLCASNLWWGNKRYCQILLTCCNICVCKTNLPVTKYIHITENTSDISIQNLNPTSKREILFE